MLRRIPFLLAILLAVAGTARAEVVYLKGGDTLRGEVLDIGEAKLAMSLEGLEGSRIEIPLTRISQFGLYELKRARIDPRSAEAHEALGDWALERNLFAFAMEEFAEARRIAGDQASPSLAKKLEGASSRCGQDKLDRGGRLESEGHTEEAVRFYRSILEDHPDCPAVQKARERIETLRKQTAAARTAARDKAEARKTIEDVKQGLALADELREKGDRLRQLGYLDSGSLGKAEDDFLAAIRAYRRAAQVLAKVSELPGAKDIETDLGTARQTLDRRLVDVYVDVGHNYVVKGNLVLANQYMGLALSIDPNNPKALSLRQAIAIATGSDNWGRAR